MNAEVTAGDVRYYITAYSDEVAPCDCSLAGWADWLSRPDRAWNRAEAARSGDTFNASVLRFADDLIATRTAGTWALDREPGEIGFAAIRYGQGLGWSGDNIVSGEDMKAAVLEWLTENDAFCDDVEFVAVAHHEPDVRLIYRAGPPPALDVEVVQ